MADERQLVVPEEALVIDTDRAIELAWHDVSCPEADECRDREQHAHAAPLANSGMLRRFVTLLLTNPDVLAALVSHQVVQLTGREREIVALVAAGYPNKTIATTLGISPWTVASYLRRVFVKLDVSSKAQLVAVAMQRGLLTPGSAGKP